MNPCELKDRWPENRLTNLPDAELAAFLEHARTCRYHALMKADIEAPWHQAFAAIPLNAAAGTDDAAYAVTDSDNDDPLARAVEELSAVTREREESNRINKERWMQAGAPARGFAVTDNDGNRMEVRIGVTSLTWDKSLNIPFAFNEVLHLVKLADDRFPEIILETFELDSVPFQGASYKKKLPSGLTIMCELHHTEQGWSVSLDYREPEGQRADGKAAGKARGAGMTAGGTDFTFHHLIGASAGAQMGARAWVVAFLFITLPVIVFAMMRFRSPALYSAVPLGCDASFHNLVARSSPEIGADGPNTGSGAATVQTATEQPCGGDDNPCATDMAETVTVVYRDSKQEPRLLRHKTESGQARNQAPPKSTAPDALDGEHESSEAHMVARTEGERRLHSLAKIKNLSLDSHVDPDLRNTMKDALSETGRFTVADDDDTITATDARLKLTVIGEKVSAEIWIGEELLWSDSCGCDSLSGKELYRRAVPALVGKLLRDIGQSQDVSGNFSVD